MMKTIENVLKGITIDMDSEETLIDFCGGESDINKESNRLFLENVRVQLSEDGLADLGLEMKNKSDLQKFFTQSNSPIELNLQIICNAAYCCWISRNLKNDKSHFYEGEHTFWISWNEFDDMRTKYIGDIDLF